MFLGPLALPERAAAIPPLPSFALDHPLGVRITRIMLGTIAAAACLRESSRLNPLLPRAYTLDGIAMPFVGAAVVDSIECVLLMWAFAMTALAG